MKCKFESNEVLDQQVAKLFCLRINIIAGFFSLPTSSVLFSRGNLKVYSV